MNLKPHSLILFQGDSITDAGRSRFAAGPNSPAGMGFGYPRLVMDQLLEEFPGHDLQFFNRGVSGDRVQDLARRWPQDTLRLAPDLISVLIGVNDTWNYLYLGVGSSPEGFLKIYRQILGDTRQALPHVGLILCEPFILLTGEVTEEWEEDLASRQAHVRALAGEFDAVLVPFQSALAGAAAGGVPPHQLLDDGVHPTVRGHRMLADCWIDTVLKNGAETL